MSNSDRWPDRAPRYGDSLDDLRLRVEKLEGLVGRLTTRLFGPLAVAEADKRKPE